MSLGLPNEIWLHIFKQIDCSDLFEKRKVNKYFKNLIDSNLSYFYTHYSKIYPDSYPKKKGDILLNDFIKSETILFIRNLVQFNFTGFYINKMLNDGFNLAQSRMVLNLYQKHNLEFYHGVRCINFSSKQLTHMIELKNAGFPSFFAVKFASMESVTDNQIKTLKKVKLMGISDFFCGKLTFEFSEQQLELFYELFKIKDLYWLNAIRLAENGLNVCKDIS